MYQHARELFPIAEDFADHDWHVHVLIGWQGRSAEAMQAEAESIGAKVHRSPDELAYGDPWGAPPNDAPSEPATVAATRRSARSRLGFALFRSREALRLAARTYRARRYGYGLVDSVAPDLVFGSSYRSVGTFDQSIARAALKRGALYTCFPYGPFVGERWAIDGRAWQFRIGAFDLERIRVDASIYRRALARIFPSWVRDVGGTRVFSWDPTTMLVARAFGLVDPNPWQQPSDLYDICFVESEMSRDLLIESGYDPDKAAVVGKPLLDDVVTSARTPEFETALYETLDLPRGTRYVLCNVEPLWEHGYADEDVHWRRVEELFSALARTNLPVVLSLHPISNPDNYEALARRFGFRLPRERSIAELHPFAGAVVSFLCSTNPLALVFDKPLVVYDEFWKLTLSDDPAGRRFQQPGAVFVHELDAVETAVRDAFRGSTESEPPPYRPARERIRAIVDERLR